MSESTTDQARQEIDKSLILSTFCMRRIGLSFADPKSSTSLVRQKLMFMLSTCTICYHVFSEIMFIGVTFNNSPRVEDVVPLFHTFGYGALSISKMFVLWYKKGVFRQLLHELADIWPMPPISEQAQVIKSNSLNALHITHHWYFFVNVAGVWFYNVTPICIYLYHLWSGDDAKIGFVWVSWYPFDKHQPIAHIFVYIFEMFAGQTCVWIMVCTDLLFSAMASHISLLLKLLKLRLETLATTQQTDEEYYEDIKENIKLHQRLITYCNDLEHAFSLSNLINIVLSSINICCVVFVILLLEPFMAMSNKMFLGSALIQIGMLCWYANEIFHANSDIATAAYNSGWYRTNTRCRSALLFLIRKLVDPNTESSCTKKHTYFIFTNCCVELCSHSISIKTFQIKLAQKPIAFTAMNFTHITLVTYSSILTRSYSYFALLYTMYNKN